MTTPIAELTQNYPLAFEVIWVGLGMISFITFASTPTLSSKDARHECMYASLWCLGASILVLLASV